MLASYKLRKVIKTWNIISRNVSFNSLIDIKSNIKNDILSGKPVVALESTIISHGMPYPQNIETALKIEETVRNEGSTPATIAVIDGRLKVGLTKRELEILAQPKYKNNVLKLSKKDLPYAISTKVSGGTTVAGTLFIANKVGIRIFATGGIGGVHRDSNDTLDISADLVELGKTPIMVVCSGVKSILDIPKTLEFLETHGVLVSSYTSSSCEFPAFYTEASGCKVSYNLNNPKEAANLVHSLLKLESNSGILLGVPIPKEYSVPAKLINDAIGNALEQAKEAGVKGKNVTPFLLDAISKITKGISLKANIALIENNARVASKIAYELYNIFSQTSNEVINSPQIKSESYLNTVLRQKAISQELESEIIESVLNKDTEITPLVIGASILDITMKVKDEFILNGATYCAETKTSGGGVGRNIAEGIWKLFGNVNFISAVGNDEIGVSLKQKLPVKCTKGIISIQNNTTSMCNVILDKTGECKLLLGDMEIHKEITPNVISHFEEFFAKTPLVIMDGNLTVEAMERVLYLAKKYNKPVFYEPTDMMCAHKPFHLPEELTNQIKIISPNIHELHVILQTLRNRNLQNIFDISVPNEEEQIINAGKLLLLEAKNMFDCIILTLGSSGVIIKSKFHLDDKFYDSQNMYQKQLKSNPIAYHFKPPPITHLVNVLGAGDSFCSGFISAMLQRKTLHDCVVTGFSAAKSALQSEAAVPEKYTFFEESLLCQDMKL